MCVCVCVCTCVSWAGENYSLRGTHLLVCGRGVNENMRAALFCCNHKGGGCDFRGCMKGGWM